MYFIPRNNKLYHYVAHTNVKNRYLFTGFFLVTIVFLSVYCFQRLITTYTDIYEQELASLQKQYKNGERMETKNNQLIIVIDDTKKEIQEKIFAGNGQEYFKKQLLFILDLVKGSGLKLHSYGVQKEKNKKWYKKEVAHFDLTGSLKQIMNFFELIKNSQKMVSVAQWTLVRADENTFHVHCDIEFVLVSPA